MGELQHSMGKIMISKKKVFFAIAAIFFIFLLLSCAPSKQRDESLSQQAFKSPDQTYFPKTWMHAMRR